MTTRTAARLQPDAAGEYAEVNTTNSGGGFYDVYLGPSYTVPAGGDTYALLVVGSNASGTVNHSTGTLTLSDYLSLGENPGGNGTYNLSGGTLSTVETTLGLTSTGTFMQTGGTHTVGSSGLLLGVFSGSNGTYTLSGGTLQTFFVQGGSGTSTFNFNGGVLEARESRTDFFQSVTSAKVQAGGAKIDTNTFNVTIAQPLLHDPALGATVDGGLLKQGAGTLTLTRANSYTGATTVSAGTLTVENNNLTTSSGRLANTNAIVLNNGGTMRLSGSSVVTDRLNNAAPLTINGGGTFATGGLKEGTAPTSAGGVGGTAGLGALTLSTISSTGRAIFDFGNTAAGSTLVFSSLDALSKGAFVSVLNWTGSHGLDTGSATNDRLLFQTNPNFSETDLANWQFTNDGGVNYLSGARLIDYNGYFEMVPVPEPGTWAAGFLAAGLLGWTQRRRFAREPAAAG